MIRLLLRVQLRAPVAVTRTSCTGSFDFAQNDVLE
jgi:hypothetical protein